MWQEGRADNNLDIGYNTRTIICLQTCTSSKWIIPGREQEKVVKVQYLALYPYYCAFHLMQALLDLFTLHLSN